MSAAPASPSPSGYAWGQAGSLGFEFLDPGELRDGELFLRLRETQPALGAQPPTYKFEMRQDGAAKHAGRIELRMGNTDEILLFAGHIGYTVEPDFRGQHYAARSCRLLFALAKRHGYTELWITCDPDNTPSRRTCEILGGDLVSIIQVPREHPFFRAGSRAKCRFRYVL